MIPDSIDCVIVGTGLTNSIIAAACSRVGKSVLHVDKNNYYGGEWASFTFQQLIDWIKSQHPDHESLQSVPEDLITKSRMFCIDLCPRLLYSDGRMVELLVKSNVARYHEFKNNIRILSIVNDEIHIMPCRRSDVFTSPLLSDLLDKRRLMKFIEMCIKFNPESESEETKEISQNSAKPIGVFLQERGLKFNLCQYIINSIAMVSPNESTSKACQEIKRFMIATERFGRSPFIFPLYGCGEFPQSFCRLSAVFGGLYCLNTQVDQILACAAETCKSEQDLVIKETSAKFKMRIVSHNQEIECQHLVVSHQDVEVIKPLALILDKSQKQVLSRAILITKRSIIENDENLLTFSRIPREGRIIYLLELNSNIMVCPNDMNIVYLWTYTTSENSQECLKEIVQTHFQEEFIMWRYYYDESVESYETNSSSGVHVTNPPCQDIDYDTSIREAEKIFEAMFPGEEFLPRAPDPDEIVT